MDFKIYLAVTAAEMAEAGQTQMPLAWMGCQLSAGGSGISGVPDLLPTDSVMILTDQMPPQGHDPQQVAQELLGAVHTLNCNRILLDFQRPVNDAGLAIVRCILEQADCPVGVSENYGKDLSCPVFLRPPPLWTPLEEHIAPWKGRNIWLEAAQEDALVCVTEAGSSYELWDDGGDYPFRDEKLQIAYRLETAPDCLRVFLHRGPEELQALLEKAKQLGISTAIGLYQHLK